MFLFKNYLQSNEYFFILFFLKAMFGIGKKGKAFLKGWHYVLTFNPRISIYFDQKRKTKISIEMLNFINPFASYSNSFIRFIFGFVGWPDGGPWHFGTASFSFFLFERTKAWSPSLSSRIFCGHQFVLSKIRRKRTTKIPSQPFHSIVCGNPRVQGQ